MSPEQAHAIWQPLTWPGEGWLDAALRVDQTRGLTAEEREATDVLWEEFGRAMQRVARFRNPVSPEEPR